MSGMKINMDRANRILGWLLGWLFFIILPVWSLIYELRNGNPEPFRNYDWLLLFVPLAALYHFGYVIYDAVFPVADSVWNKLEKEGEVAGRIVCKWNRSSGTRGEAAIVLDLSALEIEFRNCLCPRKFLPRAIVSMRMPLSDVSSIWYLSGGSHDEGYMQIFTRHGLAKVPKDGIGYEPLHDELLATVGVKKSPVAYDDDFGMSRVGVYLMLTGVAVGCYLMPNAAAIDTVVFNLFTFMISFAVLGYCVLVGLDNRYGINLVPPIALGYEFMIAVLLVCLYFFDWMTDHAWIFMSLLAAGFSLGFYVVMRYRLDPLEPPRKVPRRGQAKSGKRV